MRIFFISSLDFSANGAAQNRQRYVIEGLQALGHIVKLINPIHSSQTGMLFPVDALPHWSRYIPRRLLALPFVALKLGKHTKHGDLVLCFDRNQLSLIPAFCVRRLRRLRILHEITEYPAETMPKSALGVLSLFLFERFYLPRLDGLLVISRALQSYVMPRARTSRIIRIPAIASSPENWTISDETERNAYNKVAGSAFTFIYAGSLSEHKDGVLSLLSAFAQAFEGKDTARLFVLGYGSDEQKSEVRKVIKYHDLSDTVTLHDPVAQADLPAWLRAGDALVLCRPLSRQASYGFPTKLVEYLSTSRPVISTLTSDIGHYLRDSASAFLVPPNDTAAFASALRQAASDPESSNEIGCSGYSVFKSEFEVGQAVIKLSDWIRAEFSPERRPF